VLIKNVRLLVEFYQSFVQVQTEIVVLAATLLELQSFYSMIQIIADEWIPMQYLLRDVLTELSQNSSGNIKTTIEKLLRRWGPEPDISVETGLLLFNYRRDGLKQLRAILQLPDADDTFELTMSERIQASWEKQQHRARRIALCLRSPKSHARSEMNSLVLFLVRNFVDPISMGSGYFL
jgi:hypothetical protein